MALQVLSNDIIPSGSIDEVARELVEQLFVHNHLELCIKEEVEGLRLVLTTKVMQALKEC